MQTKEEKEEFMESAMEKFGEAIASLGNDQIQNFKFKELAIVLKVSNSPEKMAVTCTVKIDDKVHKNILG